MFTQTGLLRVIRVDEDTWSTLYQEAVTHFGNNRYDLALPIIDTLISNNKLRAPALLVKAEIKFKEKDLQAAIELARLSMQIEPSETACHMVAALSFACKKYVDTVNIGASIVSESPENFKMWNFLAGAYRALGRVDRSIKIRRDLLKRDPNNQKWWSALLLDLIYDAQDRVADIKNIADHWALQITAGQRIRPYRHAEKSAKLKTKVGIISGDFRLHSAAYFLMPLVYRLDRSKFELYLYFCGFDNQQDVVSRQFESAADKFTLVDPSLRLEDNVNQIRADGLDIILDAGGLTSWTILPILMHRVAPVQASFLGYPGTTGFKNIDYVLAPVTIDEGIVDGAIVKNDEFTESLALFPSLPWCYRPFIHNSVRRYLANYGVKDTPALKNGFITFGCCSHPGRFNDDLLCSWVSILTQLPTSRLLLEIAIGDESTKDYFLDMFEKKGLARDRVFIIDQDSKNQYLTYHQIDIVLDPFPCNAGTTTCDALWMGVPVITKTGLRFRERIGEYLLHQLNLTEFTAYTTQSYVDKAVALARDLARLKLVRKNIRRRFLNTTLGNEVLYSRMFEKFITQAVNQKSSNRKNLILSLRDVNQDQPVKNYVFAVDGSKTTLREASESLEIMVTQLQSIEKRQLMMLVDAIHKLANAILKTDPQSHRAIFALAKIEREAGSKSVALEYLAVCLDFYSSQQRAYAQTLLEWACEDGNTDLALAVKQKYGLHTSVNGL